MTSSCVSNAISSRKLEATILAIRESAVVSSVNVLKNSKGFNILYLAYASTLILFLSLVNNDSGGTSTRCKRLSNLFTESIYGTFNFKPGVTYEDRNSPNLVTIATSVSFIWNRAWNNVNKEIITKTINGVNFLFI